MTLEDLSGGEHIMMRRYVGISYPETLSMANFDAYSKYSSRRGQIDERRRRVWQPQYLQWRASMADDMEIGMVEMALRNDQETTGYIRFYF